MKNTRRVLFAQNTQLQAQLAACGPDATLSRSQLRARLKTARSEVAALTARTTSQTAQIDALSAEVAALRKARNAQPA